jgi:hypothetical protein
MTTSRLTVRASEGAFQGDVDGWTALVILAALSAEPENFGELAQAVERYEPDRRPFDQFRDTVTDEESRDSPWCLIDLLGRTAVAGSGFKLPEPRDAFEADADDHAEGFPIVWLDTPADWLFLQAGDDWRATVAARALARTSVPPVNARAVLFGQPLLQYLTDGVLRASSPAMEEERQQELTRAIHGGWLVSAHADLGGRTPRETLLAERLRIASDLEHRAQQWSMQGHAVAALSTNSTAYRFGGFGTTEVVLYFDLVRALLTEAWELTRQEPRLSPGLLVERLAEFRDAWLQAPNEGSRSMSRAELIENERRRMPVTSDGSHLDCDCPICKAEAEGNFGPMFMWFDGHHLDLEDEYAFSLCTTLEEWNKEQKGYRDYAEEMDRKERERAARGEDETDPLTASAWQSSFVNWDTVAGPDASPQELLFALAFPLAELIGDLKDRADGRDLLEALNRAYSGLRTVTDEIAIDSAAQELRGLLEQAADKFPDLTAKCADFQSRLDEVLRRLV